jgi:hypothetical protein
MTNKFAVKRAVGALFIHPKPTLTSEYEAVQTAAGWRARRLKGFVVLVLNEEEDGAKLRLSIAAQVAHNSGHDHYVLSFAGERGVLLPVRNKVEASAPDYTGAIGANAELYLEGWRRHSTNPLKAHIEFTLCASGGQLASR